MADHWQEQILMVIPSINGAQLLRRMLPTLRFRPANVVVLDQGSTDDTAAVCEDAGVVLVQLGHPHTYTQASNIGAAMARERGAKYVCISNNDIAFRTDVLGEMHAEMERDPRLGIVAPSQLIIDEKLNRAVLSRRVSWNLEDVAFLHDTGETAPAVRRLEADFCELTCSLIRMSAVDEIGFLDDEYGFYHEDSDFGFRLRQAGYGCAYLPASQIDHFSSSTISLDRSSRKADYIRKNRAYFARKHLGFGVRHKADPDWSRSDWGQLNRQLHGFLHNYGLLDEDAPELRVSYPGVESTGYLLTTAETIRNPQQWREHGERYAAIFTTSRHAREQVARHGVGNVDALPLGIDPDVFHPWVPAHRLHDETTYLAVVDGQQNRSLDLVLAAWHRFAAGGRNVRLVLLGRGLGHCLTEAPDTVRRTGRVEIASYGEARVETHEILSPLRPEEYAACYRAADFAIFASRGEGAFLPVLESMACGVPCLFGDFGSTAEMAFEGALTFATPDGLLARLEDSAALDAAGRARIVTDGFYKVRGQATLRHTAMGLYAALSRLQTRDPARFLRRLQDDAARAEQDERMAGIDDSQGGLRGRLSRFTARRVSTVGHLTSQFGNTWQARGLAAAGRATARRLGGMVLRRSRRVTDLGGAVAKQVRGKAEPREPVAPPAPPVPNSALLIGYIDAQLGLGQSLRGLALALSQTPVAFGIYNFTVGVEGRRGDSYMPERYDQTRPHAVNIIEVTTDELPNVFENVDEGHFRQSYNILRTYWELGRAPEAWRGNLDRVDEIWAPNTFIAQSFQSIFDRTITVVPPCVELPPVTLDGHRRFRLQDGVFYFLFSFDYYSFPERKNPQAVVRAFRRAFPDPATPVGLIIKSAGAVDHHLTIKEDLRIAAQYDGRIDILDESLNRQEMLALIQAADCYVSLHRAEGFGFGMVEAMAMGKAVIGTDYSGCTDFLTEQTGFPVSYQLRKVGADEYVHTEGQVWAEPNEAACAEAMARVFNDRAEAAARARQAQAFVEAHYSPAAVGRVAAARLETVFAELAARPPIR